MSKAPETIWACESASGQCVVSFSTPSEYYRIEYRRADLLDSTIGAKLMQERAADAIRKRGQGEIEVALIGPTTRAFYEAYEIILALPAPTDAEVLAAAMELPQIKALKLIRDELDNLLDAITADDKFGDRSLTITGPTSNLKWLIEAQDDARSAIAAYADLVRP